MTEERLAGIPSEQLNCEVFVAGDRIVKVADRVINALKRKAAENPRKRARLCAHRAADNPLHEMLIVLTNNTYIRPHKHPSKSESFHIIEGRLDVLVFDEGGDLIEVVRMGDYASGQAFYYRIADPYYHAPLIRSDYAVFHETTDGPFRRSDTIFAPWAPEEHDDAAVEAFMSRIARDIETYHKVAHGDG